MRNAPARGTRRMNLMDDRIFCYAKLRYCELELPFAL